MRIYVAGAMTGKPDFAYPAFMAAAEQWRACGWDVLNPAERFGGRTDLPYDVYINHSLLDVICCDAVAALPGWEQSSGATLEVLYARTVGKPVYRADYPGRSNSGGLRAETGGLRPPAVQLQPDGTAADGVSGAAMPTRDNEHRRADDHDTGQDGAAVGVAGSQGLGGGHGGVHGDLREGDGDRPVDPRFTTCRRCTRPLAEHPPFGSVIDQFACEEFLT